MQKNHISWVCSGVLRWINFHRYAILGPCTLLLCYLANFYPYDMRAYMQVGKDVHKGYIPGQGFQ